MQMLSEVVDAGLVLDDISEKDLDHLEKQVGDALAKAEEKRVKQTCTCTWDHLRRTQNPDCPIHGGQDEPIRDIENVELPSDPTPGSVQRNGDEVVE